MLHFRITVFFDNTKIRRHFSDSTKFRGGAAAASVIFIRDIQLTITTVTANNSTKYLDFIKSYLQIVDS